MWKQRRQQLFIDNVQRALILRVVAYWLFCLLSAMLMACCWMAWADPPGSSVELCARILKHYAPAFAATLLVMPLALVDVLRFSNRFVGPMFRMRQAFKMMIEGKEPRPLAFRDTDYWRDVADEFNRAFALRKESKESKESKEPSGRNAPTSSQVPEEVLAG